MSAEWRPVKHLTPAGNPRWTVECMYANRVTLVEENDAGNPKMYRSLEAAQRSADETNDYRRTHDH